MAFDGDIFRAITNLRMVLNTETDYDSPDNETTYAAMREMIEILFQLCFDTGVSGTLTEDPPDDTTGYLVDSTQSWANDAHNEHTLLICSGLAIGNLYTIDDTVNASTRLECTGDNLYSDGVRSGDSYKVLFDIKNNADGHDHDGTNSSMMNAAVNQAALDTDEADTSHTINATSFYDFTLPGGAYGFPNFEVKGDAGGHINATGYLGDDLTGSYSYVTFRMSNADETQQTGYINQLYITSSGEIFWYMVMRDKVTKDIIAQYCGNDHPCMPQQRPPEDYPHPWVDEFDPDKHEIIVMNPDSEMVEEIRLHREKCGRTRLEVIEEEYEIDESEEPEWPTKAITIGLPPKWARSRVPGKKSNDKIKPIKGLIPRPEYIKTAALKPKKAGKEK